MIQTLGFNSVTDIKDVFHLLHCMPSSWCSHFADLHPRSLLVHEDLVSVMIWSIIVLSSCKMSYKVKYKVNLPYNTCYKYRVSNCYCWKTTSRRRKIAGRWGRHPVRRSQGECLSGREKASFTFTSRDEQSLQIRMIFRDGHIVLFKRVESRNDQRLHTSHFLHIPIFDPLTYRHSFGVEEAAAGVTTSSSDKVR